MRIRDKVFSEDWGKQTYTLTRSNVLILLRIIITIMGLSVIIIQSAISLNLTIFTIWISISIIILLNDIVNSKPTIGSEIIFCSVVLITSIISLKFANYDSLFFISIKFNWKITLYQLIVGIIFSLRLFITLFALEWYPKVNVLIPASEYSKKQVLEYKSNLIKTDFEFKELKKLRLLEKIAFIVQRTKLPILTILMFILLSVVYATIIALVAPSDVIIKIYITPALFFMALIYAVALARLSQKLNLSSKTETA